MRIHKHIALLGSVLVAAACADAPRDVAERFWTAAQEHDEEALRETSVEFWGDHRFDADGDNEIGAFEFGDTEIDGDEARVETRLSQVDDYESLEFSFETVLVRQDGEWLVDLEETTSRMVRSIMATTVREFSEALAEGMSEAMEELSEGLADRMREMGEALGEAFEEGASRSRAEAERGAREPTAGSEP